MKFVELGKEHIDQIYNLDRHHTPPRPLYSRYGKKDLLRLFNNPDKCSLYGIFDNNKLIAFCGYCADWSSYGSSKEGKYEICTLVVHVAYRKKGLGKKIFLHTIQKLNEKIHPKEIFLSVSPHNIPALMLYLKCGFVIVDFKKKGFHNMDRLYLHLEKTKS
jgi:ribosomal protein S18 acetylase RimI-like enzyme